MEAAFETEVRVRSPEPQKPSAIVQVTAHALSGERLCSVAVARTAASDELRTAIARALPQGLLQHDVVVFEGLPLVDRHVRPFAAGTEGEVCVTVVFSKTLTEGNGLYYMGPSVFRQVDRRLLELATGAYCTLLSAGEVEALVEALGERWRVGADQLARRGGGPKAVPGGFACAESVYYLGPALTFQCGRCQARRQRKTWRPGLSERGQWCLRPGDRVEVVAAGVLADSVRVRFSGCCPSHGATEKAVCLHPQKLSREPPKRRGLL